MQQQHKRSPAGLRPKMIWSASEILEAVRMKGLLKNINISCFLSFSLQDDPSENDIYFLEEGNTVQLPLPHATATLQLHSSQSVPQNLPRVDLSQDSSGRSNFSQFLSQAHSSQSRLGLSQVSQPKKKSARMGF